MKLKDSKHTIKINPANWPLAADLVARENSDVYSYEEMNLPVRVNCVKHTIEELVAWGALRQEKKK